MAAALLAVEQAVFEHEPQVMADRWLAQSQVLGELTHGHLLARASVDHAEQLESCRVGNHPQRLGERLRRGTGRGLDVELAGVGRGTPSVAAEGTIDGE